MLPKNFHRTSILLMSTTLLTIGCGESPSQEELFAALNLEAPPCTATFTQDYDVIDIWDDALFTATVGEKFIVAGVNDWGGDLRAEFYYLASNGAYSFDMEFSGNDLSTLPFELSCPIENSQSSLGVFSTVKVYSDEDLTQEVCTLERGASAAAGLATGYSLVSPLFSEPMIYEVELGGFSQTCGVAQGYMEAESSRIFGSSTTLVPILRYQTAAN